MDIHEANALENTALKNSATEAERLLGQYLQYLAFEGGPEPHKAFPSEFEVGPVYLKIARQMLSPQHSLKFARAYEAATQLRIAEKAKRRVQETLNENKP